MIDRLIAFLVLCLVFSIPLGVAVIFTGEMMLNFVFFWPLFMSAIWITGGIYFWFYRERKWPWGKEVPPPVLEGNPLISILIPCHRVVGSDGSLTGYAGGVANKQFLLELEGVDMTGLYVPTRGTAL